MEQRFRIEKVKNGVIFTDNNEDRFVDHEPKEAINALISVIMGAIEEAGDVVVVVSAPDKSGSVNLNKGCY